MNNSHDNSNPEKPVMQDMLVCFGDLTRFTRIARSLEALEVFLLMQDYFQQVGDAVEAGGGRVIKFLGDAYLAVYPKEAAAQGILAQLRFKEETDRWMQNRGINSKLVIKMHFGAVACGSLGTRSDPRLDVIGETVNIAATLVSHGVAITPEAFRRLDAEGRKYFKKHTPAVRYIPTTERHQE